MTKKKLNFCQKENLGPKLFLNHTDLKLQFSNKEGSYVVFQAFLY